MKAKTLNLVTTMRISESVYSIFSRRLSSLPKLPRIPTKYKQRAIKEAQQAVTDYLHHTKFIPFAYADHISRNSVYNLFSLISNAVIAYKTSDFSKSIVRFLRYYPINEFEFFFESIGIHYSEVGKFLPANKFFFSEDRSVLDAAGALSSFGFPWNMLGRLYKEEVLIFSKSCEDITSRLYGFKNDHGFSNVIVIGVCLAFPHVLLVDDDELFDDLKRVFVDFDLVSWAEENVDSWYELCRKIRLFYDLGCEKGKLGELLAENKRILIDHSEEVLAQKLEYFCRFGVRKVDVALLLLKCPEILSFDLETPVISVEGLFSHFGLSTKEVKSISEKYPYILGRNKMANLPHVMRAANLQDWFFDKIRNGNHQLLGNYALSNPDEDFNKEFRDGLERVQSSKLRLYTMNKLTFLHGIGYGENALTMKVLAHLHGSCSELQDRFDCLLRCGIEFSKVCTMIRLSPKVLNQNPETIEQKVDFLCQHMGASLDYLDKFPTFLCFDLQYRIKPRYKFHMWLIEKGLSSKNYSIGSMVATSEKSFITRVYRIHPAAPKLWFECFLRKRPHNNSLK
ncbi:transcription termination factor MTEF18, mitochondrial [Mangifera indica]|uniref:transcription termination factor MTEF18, mitochondrial n=1 Tax=Mangifera indica TaxID=29780 RepID=UPI001CF97409|nr:transcription termination factor MTEF18, mitochondrial [Mangifera indica]